MDEAACKRRDDATKYFEDIAQLAIQGPKAESILQKLTEIDLSEIGSFKFAQHVKISGITDVLVSRTGYTGENGYELYLSADKAEVLWEKILEAGATNGLKPCGLGARDTLRLESRLALYGQELITISARLKQESALSVKTNKESDFIGKSTLTQQKETGLKRKLVGIEVIGRGIPRHGYKIISKDGEEIGIVTSGTQSPSLKKSLGLALVSADQAEVGTPDTSGNPK